MIYNSPLHIAFGWILGQKERRKYGKSDITEVGARLLSYLIYKVFKLVESIFAKI